MLIQGDFFTRSGTVALKYAVLIEKMPLLQLLDDLDVGGGLNAYFEGELIILSVLRQKEIAYTAEETYYLQSINALFEVTLKKLESSAKVAPMTKKLREALPATKNLK